MLLVYGMNYLCTMIPPIVIMFGNMHSTPCCLLGTRYFSSGTHLFTILY